MMPKPVPVVDDLSIQEIATLQLAYRGGETHAVALDRTLDALVALRPQSPLMGMPAEIETLLALTLPAKAPYVFCE